MEDVTVTVEETQTCIDVASTDNSATRWKNALNYYRQNCSHIRSARTNEKIRCVAIMDTSYSMDGRRIICVKLGLCSLLANFEPEDEVNVIAFASKVKSISGGFKSVSELIDNAPQLLHEMHTDGCTACYDAIIEGIGTMRDRSFMYESFATSSPDDKFKNIAIVLTDGEDNESRHNPLSVERCLLNPRIKNFMFLMVSVDMTKRWERKFRRWMDLNHCKQVRVNVKTGSSLVGVFKEMLLCRILQTESSNVRFLQDGASLATSQAINEDGLTEEDYKKLRAMYLREVNDVDHPHAERDCDDEEDEDGCDFSLVYPNMVRNGSEGVSSVCSCSDGGDWKGDFLMMMMTVQVMTIG